MLGTHKVFGATRTKFIRPDKLVPRDLYTREHDILIKCGNNNTRYISIAGWIYIGINFSGLSVMSCEQA